MKLEHLIVQQLFRNKKVSLQNIGTFYLADGVALPAEDDKSFVLPENSVRFEFDKRANRDDDFIGFIMEKTGKMRPLATSDLESFTLFTRQFINIGKPIPIEGLGVLQKNQEGNYEFVPGLEIHPPAESQTPAAIKERADEHIDFSSSQLVPKKKSKWGWIGLITFLLAVSASVYFYQQEKKSENNLQKLIPVADSSNQEDDAVVVDSTLIKDSIAAALENPQWATPSATDSLQIVFKSFKNYDAANAALAKFQSYGHPAKMYVPGDSSKFELYMSFPKTGTDSTRLLDSLSLFFGTRAYIKN